MYRIMTQGDGVHLEPPISRGMAPANVDIAFAGAFLAHL